MCRKKGNMQGRTHDRPKGYLNKSEAAKILGVTKRTVDNWMLKRFLPFYRFGRSIAFKDVDLLAAIESCRVPATWERAAKIHSEDVP